MIGRLYSRFVFPVIADYALSRPHIAERRKAALAQAAGRILEIGFGSGLNLAHYPPGVRKISTVEPNAGMTKLARKRIAASGMEIEIHHSTGAAIPYGEGEFDSVVCTWTLCSVDDLAGVMGEVGRVLKPGGRFLFLEHGASGNPKTKKWQDRLTPINRIIADGCHLNRDIPAIVESGGLKIVRLEKSTLENAPSVMGNIYMGVAEKEK
ncbi:MAG: class I SAM-dependent methyltransferase [Nitrospinae bacterium]|nr:class I SAM-dependent methyltransferase [Nitrospinota bacterium]